MAVNASRGSLASLWLSAVVVVLDQWSKYVIEHRLAVMQAVDVLPVLQITRLHNTGVAFSFFDYAGGWQRWVFTALAVVVSLALGVWLARIDRGARVLGAAVALILGGACGNAIDRVRLGHVIDFIYAHWNEHYFPAFNIADSAITVGAGLLLLDTWLASHRTASSGQRS
jgi:signal peptidase II